jgi:hypothetical protein
MKFWRHARTATAPRRTSVVHAPIRPIAYPIPTNSAAGIERLMVKPSHQRRFFS